MRPFNQILRTATFQIFRLWSKLIFYDSDKCFLFSGLMKHAAFTDTFQYIYRLTSHLPSRTVVILIPLPLLALFIHLDSTNPDYLYRC